MVAVCSLCFLCNVSCRDSILIINGHGLVVHVAECRVDSTTALYHALLGGGGGYIIQCSRLRRIQNNRHDLPPGFLTVTLRESHHGSLQQAVGSPLGNDDLVSVRKEKRNISVKQILHRIVFSS